VIAVSDEDGNLLGRELDAGKVHIIPNIVPSYLRRQIPRKPVLVFIGSYAWSPNVDAVRWFTEKIWPAVHSARSAARFLIIGSGVPEQVQALEKWPGVEVVGFVTDTAPYLEEAAISVAPLRFGGGMKGKVNEALAHGIPVVTTAFGAQGFNAVNGKEMIIADDPEDFADAIIRLLDDPVLQWEVGMAGQALNERLCSPETVSKKISETLLKALLIRSGKRKKASFIKILSWKTLGIAHRIVEIFNYNMDKYFRK
jgi:glycosyltransferase involved in cell wall biosynthesis